MKLQHGATYNGHQKIIKRPSKRPTDAHTTFVVFADRCLPPAKMLLHRNQHISEMYTEWAKDFMHPVSVQIDWGHKDTNTANNNKHKHSYFCYVLGV